MNKNDIDYTNFIKILEEELLPAMGCTEPIAVAYCAAMARKTLGAAPDRVVVEASGNIIKNVKSVIVPNTGHLRGIPAAAAAGIVAGNADKAAGSNRFRNQGRAGIHPCIYGAGSHRSKYRFLPTDL